MVKKFIRSSWRQWLANAGSGAKRKKVAASIADVTFSYERGPHAILLIHGVTGTPTEMSLIGKQLAQQGYSVHGVQLAGHCGSEKDLAKTNWKDWYHSVECDFDKLYDRYASVSVLGLCAGSLLALLLAERRGAAVKALILCSPLLHFDGWAWPRYANFLLPWVVALPFAGRLRFKETHPYGIKNEKIRKRVVAKMHAGDSAAAGAPAYTGKVIRQLIRLIKVVKQKLYAINTAALIIHAKEDDVTSLRSALDIHRQLPEPSRLVVLENSYHIITIDQERDRVVAETVRFLSRRGAMPQLTGDASD